MDAIFHRISVRKYEDRPVEPEKLEKLLRAAMAAPSACNQQPWESYVVQRKEKLAELATATPYTAFTARGWASPRSRSACGPWRGCWRFRMACGHSPSIPWAIPRNPVPSRTGMTRQGYTG